MPEFKEKPKMGRPKAKPPSAMHPKQAARMMKEKYLQQLDQRPEGADSETIYATDQVEGASRWATDEAVSHAPRPQGSTKTSRAFRERTRTIFKTRSGPVVKPSAPAMKVKPPAARAAKKAARQTVQRQMTNRMVAQAQRAAKTTMTAAKKAAEAVVRAVTALVSGLMGLLGGGILVVILLLVAVVAAIVSSPFGIFFAGGSSGGSGTAGVSAAEAVAQINTAYHAKLAQVQTGNYNSIEVSGSAADWPDVLAVFAVRYAGATDGVAVGVLDADRVSKLTATFWDMTAVTATVETVFHPDSDPRDQVDDSWTERILHVTVTAKTAEEMKTAYGFTAYQISALDELLADRAALEALAGSSAVTN